MRFYSGLLAIVLAGGLAHPVFAQKIHGKEIHESGVSKFVFPIHGPSESTTIPEGRSTSYSVYDSGSPNRLAILLSDTNSNWLALAHGLKSIGVPFRITRSAQEAFRHHVILCYPSVPSQLGPDEMSDVVQKGATIIAVDPDSERYGGVFGYKSSKGSDSHYRIHFLDSLDQKAGLSDSLETTIPFASPRSPALFHQSLSYELTRGTMEAMYDDGQAAIVHNAIGTGQTYAIGIDIGYLIALGYGNRQETIARSYANRFEPTIDVILRILKGIYETAEPNAVTLWPVPEGKSLAVLLTHDIDYGYSMRNALDYAKLETSYGVPATYFVQTKYITDYEDRAFLDDTGILEMRMLDSMGMEIASHSVSHSYVFSRFPIGSGQECYPDYCPFVRNRDTTTGGTVLGELRASKFPIETILGKRVASFRPGFLANPEGLPQALCATGYSNSSSVTANDVLTHLPYQLTYGRASKQELPLFSFPITIEDGEKPPVMDQRLASAIELSKKIARYGGLSCVLIHPNIFDYKYRFEQGFVPAVRPFSWFGTMQEYGEFWSARNEVSMDVSDSGDGKILSLYAPREIRGLTISVPGNWNVQPADGLRVISSNLLVLKRLQGNKQLIFVTPKH